MKMVARPNSKPSLGRDLLLRFSQNERIVALVGLQDKCDKAVFGALPDALPLKGAIFRKRKVSYIRI